MTWWWWISSLFSVLLLFVTCVEIYIAFVFCVAGCNTLEACPCCRVEEPLAMLAAWHNETLTAWAKGSEFSRKSKSTPDNANPARKHLLVFFGKPLNKEVLIFKWFLLSLRLFFSLIAGNRQGPNGPIPRKTAWMVANDGCACTYRYGRTWEPRVLERILLQWQRLIGTISVSILKKSKGICKSHSHWLD